jgi:hypothetical protein
MEINFTSKYGPAEISNRVHEGIIAKFGGLGDAGYLVTE